MQEKRDYRKWRLEDRERRFLLVMGDLLAAVIALFLALYIWASGDEWLNFSINFLQNRAPTWFYLLPLLWLVLLIDTYDSQKSGSRNATLKGIGIAIAVAMAIYLLVYFASPPNSLPRLGVAYFFAAAAVLTFIWRVIYIHTFRAYTSHKRVLIIGAGKAGSALVEIIKEQETPPFTLVGLIDDDPSKLGENVFGYPILGNHTQLEEIITSQEITDLILAISNEMNHGMFQAVLYEQEKGLTLSTMVETFESLSGRVPIGLLESDWIIRSFLERTPASGFYRLFKRLLDLAISLILLIILLVIYPFIALLILIDSGRPVIYQQERLGRGGKPYVIYKFRTMRNKSDMVREALVTANNDPRVTRVGRFMRKSHLDELPQVINVLRGEMSLVGPRSERSELVILFQTRIPFYRARLLVKPGITGWAQIHQNYAENVEETAVKLEYDLYYIEHASFWMDINILMRTVGSVLGFKGR